MTNSIHKIAKTQTIFPSYITDRNFEDIEKLIDLDKNIKGLFLYSESAIEQKIVAIKIEIK